jgi:energy-coupling factor transporter ATP-binding protein EcfA2
MKIKSVRIENFRSFVDTAIYFNGYTCLVGANGAGKSTVLSALNVFFRERAGSSTDITKLIDEDYFCKRTENPLRITVTFNDLNDAARTELAAYIRHDELVVTAEAQFDTSCATGSVRHFGQRLGMELFRPFFEAEKNGARAAELNEIYTGLQGQYPDLPAARSKDDKMQALRDYEAHYPDQCILIPSADDFYGINSTGKLARFIQWVYVPAVKDAGEEGIETKNTALSKLVARAVQNRTDFDAELEQLKIDTVTRYEALLERNQAGLNDISDSLQRRLGSWAHTNVRLGMKWLSDSKSIVVQAPVVGIKTGDADFLGSLTRMGHGLQRSYLLALLQELAASETPDAPTLLLGCEEPELYQHPPQARHLADVFEALALGNNQIIVTTHSPYFVSGAGFENARVVQQRTERDGSQVKSLTFVDLCAAMRGALGQDPMSPVEGLIAKIHQSLQPTIAEMFFTRIPILVEGLEDISYITTELHLSGRWNEFRRLGCHLIAANGKDKLIQPTAIAAGLGLPFFLVFDADGNTVRPDHRIKHERDNTALLRLLNVAHPSFPDAPIVRNNHAIWSTNLGDVVKADFGADYEVFANGARNRHGNEGGIEKHDLFIADWLTAASDAGRRSPTLNQLCSSILHYARNV